jgi:protein-disulfide isomerase
VPLLEQVLEKYPGKVKLVFKNFPLQNHAQAKPAATAALAAGKEGKFWEYHDKVFENYKGLNDDVFQEIARELGLDMKAFNAARTGPELAAAVDRDIQEGRRAGVRGTPTIFVNGRRLQQRSLQGFSQAIDRELKRLGGG